MTSPSRVTWEQANEAICSSMKAEGTVGALGKRMRQYSMQEELEIKRLLSTESVLARHWMNVGVQLLEKHEVLTRAQIDRVTAAEAEGGRDAFSSTGSGTVPEGHGNAIPWGNELGGVLGRQNGS